MGMTVNVDNSKKILNVALNSVVTTEAATAKVLAEYNQIVGRVNPKEYSLLIDCTDMGVFQTDAIETLTQLYKLYMSTGFKHIVFIKSKQPIQNMQLSKAANMVPGFSGVFVDSMADALKACI
jgi:hypothetical protein